MTDSTNSTQLLTEQAVFQAQEKVWSHTVGLVIFEIDETGRALPDRGFSLGSGVLIECEGRHLIATCAHSFATVGERPFAVLPLARDIRSAQPTDYIDRSQVTVPARREFAQADPGDLAFINTSQDRFRSDRHNFYRLQKPIPDLDAPVSVIACGVPGELGVYRASSLNANLVGPMIIALANLKTDPIWSDTGERVRDTFRATITPSQYLDRTGEVLDFPKSLGGLSGGGLWAFDQNLNPFLIGITVREDSTSLEAVSINRWLELVHNSTT